MESVTKCISDTWHWRAKFTPFIVALSSAKLMHLVSLRCSQEIIFSFTSNTTLIATELESTILSFHSHLHISSLPHDLLHILWLPSLLSYNWWNHPQLHREMTQRSKHQHQSPVQAFNECSCHSQPTGKWPKSLPHRENTLRQVIFQGLFVLLCLHQRVLLSFKTCKPSPTKLRD